MGARSTKRCYQDGAFFCPFWFWWRRGSALSVRFAPVEKDFAQDRPWWCVPVAEPDVMLVASEMPNSCATLVRFKSFRITSNPIRTSDKIKKTGKIGGLTGTEEGETEGWKTGERRTKKKITEELKLEEREMEGRKTEERIMEERIMEERITEERITEEQITEEQITEEQITEERETEEKIKERETRGIKKPEKFQSSRNG